MTDFFTRTVPARQAAAVRIGLAVAALAKGADLWWRTDSMLALAVWTALSLAMLAGVGARSAGVGLFGLYLWYVDQGQYANHFAFLAIAVLLLALVDSGAQWSVHGSRARAVPRWPLALLRVHLCVVYFFAGLSKVNPGWFSGQYLAEQLETAMLWPVGMPPPVALAALGTATVLWELTAPWGLWWRRSRLVYLWIGVVAHPGMVLVLSNTWTRVHRLGVFAVTILSVYLLYVDERRFAASEPDVGIEPTTYRLQGDRSAN